MKYRCIDDEQDCYKNIANSSNEIDDHENKNGKDNSYENNGHDHHDDSEHIRDKKNKHAVTKTFNKRSTRR